MVINNGSCVHGAKKFNNIPMQTILIRSAMYLTKNISATVRKLTRSMMGAGDEVSGAIAARIAEALAAGVAGHICLTYY